MEYIHFETEEIQCTDQVNISDNEKLSENNDFINDSEEIADNKSLYRKLDPYNLEHYIKFSNRTQDPVSALFEDDKIFFDETDQQPELYMAQGVENVEFDNFSGFEKSVKKF